MTGPGWHSKSVESILAQLHSDAQRGLNATEANLRLERDGRNEVAGRHVLSPWRLFARQFGSLVIFVLLAAALVAGWLGEITDTIAIVAIVILNAIVGFVQEYRAERAIAALSQLAAPKARVVRDGAVSTIAAAEIVCGDILVVSAGDLVGADARLLQAAQLRTNEAPLTGESEAVEKHPGGCDPETPLADRHNMLFLGTSVVSGDGRAVVAATGMSTEVGKIAELLRTAGGSRTPLQIRLDRVARQLLLGSAAVVLLVFGLGMMRSLPLGELFLTSVSLAVAAIPEGLPSVVTVALALGAARMARRHALLRRLAAVETLGSTQVICTDKTGTLTVGEMTARKVATCARVYDVTGEGYGERGEILSQHDDFDPARDTDLQQLLVAAVACSDAYVDNRRGRATAVGDPTEAALIVLAAKAGVTRARVEGRWARVGVLPFDSDRKRMTVIHREGQRLMAFTKGAPESVLVRCSHALASAGVSALNDALRARIIATSNAMAADGLRVLAMAQRDLERFPADEDVEMRLTFLGIVGLQDPPRAEARVAVEKCRGAGIATVMITGDHPETARVIAHDLGIIGPSDQLMVGSALEQMSDSELNQCVGRTRVYARVTAEHKLRIVRAWKSHGNIVAMTGDGINDAPALEESSVGIAMGRTGTEVTKQVADLVIADDNFASIVAAIEEGRGIYDNIAKTIGYLLAGNVAELAIMLVAVVLGWPLPLLPVQLLWINLITDGLPALALASDPIEADVLSRPPRPTNSALLDRQLAVRVGLTAALTAAVALIAFQWDFAREGHLVDARNGVFSVLTIAELLRSFGARSRTRLVWEIGLFTNLRLFAVVAVSFLLQVIIHEVPAFQNIFATESITLARYLSWLALGSVPLLVLELVKLGRRHT